MRIRTIKPEFWQNEDLASLDPYARLLFIGLWNIADRAGRLEYRPRKIRALLFPYEPDLDQKLPEWLEELSRLGFISIYEAADLRVIEISQFEKHQRFSGKEAETASKLPAIGEATGKTEVFSRGSNRENLGSNGEAVIAQERSMDIRKKEEGRRIEEGSNRENSSFPLLDDVIEYALAIGSTKQKAEDYHLIRDRDGWKIYNREGHARKIANWRADFALWIRAEQIRSETNKAKGNNGSHKQSRAEALRSSKP